MMNKTTEEIFHIAPSPVLKNGKHTISEHRLIESDDFPFEELSKIADWESHRKEVYRPIYHIHKWWAQRLGSVFRGVILGSSLHKNESLLKSFYRPSNLNGLRVFDPFMGNGTTLGEAFKLNCNALGRDINPVAFQNVKVSLGNIDIKKLQDDFNHLEKTVGQEIKKLYKSYDKEGNECEVLYYFWVKVLPCPKCQDNIELFSSYIFAKHAYVKKYPTVQIYCPECSNIFEGNYSDTSVNCTRCKHTFNPHIGAVNKAKAHCKSCCEDFIIAKTAKLRGVPPGHKMYAKLVLKSNNEKAYIEASQYDRELYESISNKLNSFENKIPDSTIQPGHNTNQVINYGYTQWSQFFNHRQLCVITLLSDAIKTIKDIQSREALALLLSATLDFNNMFASYKGEGTGAVRHMFSHHILKPERTPLEANLWGTPKSSGSFSTLFKSRLVRAAEYQKNPFEIDLNNKEGKIFDLNKPFSSSVSLAWPPMDFSSPKIYISCGSSDKSKLANECIDIVVTDPPFFDNVHYSELADFFYAWHEIFFKSQSTNNLSTRSKNEVQDVNASNFSEKLKLVFKECSRVLVPNGLLVFTYHHSRKEGWVSVATAVHGAGFNFIQAHPVKSEMSGATPKHQANSPIEYDIVLVCKKTKEDSRIFISLENCIEMTIKSSSEKIERLQSAKFVLSKSDIGIIIKSELLKYLSPRRTTELLIDDFLRADAKLQEHSENLYALV